MNKISFWAGGHTTVATVAGADTTGATVAGADTTGATVAGADTTAGKNRQLPGAVTVPGLVPTRPITKHSWIPLEKLSIQCKEARAGRSPWVEEEEGGCAFADAYIHSAECKLNLEALEAADQCIRKVLFRAVWVEVFPEAEVDVKEYDDDEG